MSRELMLSMFMFTKKDPHRVRSRCESRDTVIFTVGNESMGDACTWMRAVDLCNN